MNNMSTEEVDAIFLVARHGEEVHHRITHCVRAATEAGDPDRARHWRRVRRLIARAVD